LATDLQPGGWPGKHERGSYAPLPMGGDTRSQRVEAHADFLLGLHRREPDLTLHEICNRLSRARGEKVSPSMIWRFFDRHDITFKNVWPAPSARGFVESAADPVCFNVSGLEELPPAMMEIRTLRSS
jgi:transposase